MPSTAAEASSAAESLPIGSMLFIIGLAVLLWIGWLRFIRPAVRSQAGRPDRMSPDRRIRRIAEATWWVIYPVMVTVAVLLILFGGNSKGSTGSDIWPVTLLGWMILALPMIAGLLWVVGLIVRCIERHQMRKRHRALGLPDPRPPWWPAAVVFVWAVGVIGAFVGATVVTWTIVIAYVQDRVDAIQTFPGIQDLVAAGASRTLIASRMEQAAPDQVAEIERRIETAMISNLIAFLVVIVVIIIGGIVLYGRQKRHRAQYDQRIAESVTRAAALSL
jgi:hypothetical protein